MALRRQGRVGAIAAAMPVWLAPGLLDLRGLVAGLPAWIRSSFAEEAARRRLFPWIAVAAGIGVVAAFAADGPLRPWPPLVGFALCVGLAVLLRARPVGRAAAIGAAAVFAGFAAAIIRMLAVAAPMLGTQVVAEVGGFVEALEERVRGGRLVIRVESFAGFDPASRPFRVRVTTRDLGGAASGNYVTAKLRLLPVPEAARPGGYDFARDAYFRGIGGVGSVSGKLTIVASPPTTPGWSLRLAAAVDNARNALTRRIADATGGQAGAVAAALVTGKRGLIDEPTNDALRAAGIYHIVSISGLHMVLAAGVFFWLTRAFLALSPALALGWPIKKLAALSGMAAAIAYDVFSGSDVATERSLIMILVMQGAILFDRPALSLRNLALSALIVLALEPETLLGPSLQMSYAAVAGLIAYAEWHRGRRGREEATDPFGRALRWLVAIVVGLLATTLVATVATGPFSTFHFQNLQPYGMLGNAVTLPLVSLAVMPSAVLGILAYPFGLDRPIWWLMGLAVAGVNELARWVAAIDGSVVTVPAFGSGALILLVVAILISTLCVSGLRGLAVAPAALGLGLAATAPRPDIYVARDGSGAAIRGRGGALVLVGRAPGFTASQWLKADGDGRRPDAPVLKQGARCDRLGCTVETASGTVAYVQDRRAFEEDCRRAAIVITRFEAPAGCGRLAIDRAHLAQYGATAIRQTAFGFALDTARRPGETRPWLARPPPPRGGTPPRPARGKPALPEPNPALTPDPDEDPL